ncbi:GerMN domain-containing protein [Sphaerisporangium perillae]|uniref:GerMN domain-containing protein n=1 Tax=Sphaerisporangium perillae TaxID=2935860 RepID=UPI00200E49F3|nr:GerMN domain-containing protein [Sphaerisporangium perillae]
MRRPARRRKGCLVALLLLAVGCGIQPTAATVAGDPPIARAKSQTNVVYFLKGGELVQATRPGLPNVPEYSMQQLLDGPTEVERARGLSTQVEPNEVVISREGDVLSLWGKPDTRGLALAQLVCTGTAVPGIRSVKLSWDTRRHTCAEFASAMGK